MVEQGLFDRGAGPEHEQEHRFAQQALGVLVGFDGAAADGDHQDRRGPVGEGGRGGPGGGHVGVAGVVEPVPDGVEFVVQR